MKKMIQNILNSGHIFHIKNFIINLIFLILNKKKKLWKDLIMRLLTLEVT